MKFKNVKGFGMMVKDDSRKEIIHSIIGIIILSVVAFGMILFAATDHHCAGNSAGCEFSNEITN